MKKQYLKVEYKVDGSPDSQNFKLSEVYFVNKVLLELADESTCTVTRVMCTNEEYTSLFD